MKTKCYQSCNELPLWNFIKIVTTGNLSYVVSKRGYLKADLNAAWEVLFDEYLSLSPTPQHKRMEILIKEQAVLMTRITVVDKLVSSLRYRRNDEMIDILKSMGFNYAFENLQKDLDRVISKAKTWVLRLKTVKNNLEKLGTGEKTTEADFNNILTELSQFQGYRIDPKAVSVSEYISILERYKKHSDGKQRADKRGHK